MEKCILPNESDSKHPTLGLTTLVIIPTPLGQRCMSAAAQRVSRGCLYLIEASVRGSEAGDVDGRQLEVKDFGTVAWACAWKSALPAETKLKDTGAKPSIPLIITSLMAHHPGGVIPACLLIPMG
jgi:hypothetical protein